MEFRQVEQAWRAVRTAKVMAAPLSFGRSVGGGRRLQPRRRAVLAVSLATTSRHRTALLLDISASGARLQIDNPPAVGQPLYLSVGPLELFGEVRWITLDECGMAFDEALTATQLSQVLVESIAHRGKLPVTIDRRAPGQGR